MSLLTTVAFAFYVMAVLPTLQTARLVGAAATAVWFLVSRRVAERIAREWFRSR